eukprot:12117379-Karenia_brevis.AAC.1
MGHYDRARRLQTKWEALNCEVSFATKSSADFKRIQDLAVELMHTNIEDRIRELHACKRDM